MKSFQSSQLNNFLPWFIQTSSNTLKVPPSRSISSSSTNLSKYASISHASAAHHMMAQHVQIINCSNIQMTDFNRCIERYYSTKHRDFHHSESDLVQDKYRERTSDKIQNLSQNLHQHRERETHTRIPKGSESLTNVLLEMNKLASKGKVDRVFQIWDIMQKIMKGEKITNQKNQLVAFQDITEEMVESCLTYFYVYLLKSLVNSYNIKGAEEAMQKYFITSFAEVVKPQNLIPDIQLQKIRTLEGITPVKPTTASVYTLMMKLYSHIIDSGSAQKVFQALEKDLPYHASTDTQANNTLLSAYISSKQLNTAKMFYNFKYKAPHSNLDSNTVVPDFATSAIMMKLYSELNQVEDLYKTFEGTLNDPKIPKKLLHDPYRFNIMLFHIMKSGTEEELLQFFEKHFKSSLNEKTLENRVIPTIHTYNTLFKFFSERREIGKVQKYFELMVRDREQLFSNSGNLFMDATAFHVIIDAHLKCGKERQAREIFENFFQTKKNHFDRHLMKPTVSHYNLFLFYYSKRGMQSELEEILTMMEQDDTKPDTNSALAAVGCVVKRDSLQGIEEFKRWFISDLGTPSNPRARRFHATSRVYELLVSSLIKDRKLEKMEEILIAYDKDSCRRSGSIYRKALFSYLKPGEEKLDEALRLFRTYFISPASHPNAGYKADLRMCNTLLHLAYNHENPSKYRDMIRGLRFVRDKLQQKAPQDLKAEEEEITHPVAEVFNVATA